MSCSSAVPLALCDTQQITAVPIPAGTTIVLAHNASGYAVLGAAAIPLTLVGIQPSCVTVTLVVDATATGQVSSLVSVNVAIYRASDATFVAALDSQEIKFTASTGAYAAATTSLTIDLPVGSFNIVASIASVAAVTVDARVNILAVKTVA